MKKENVMVTKPAEKLLAQVPWRQPPQLALRGTFEGEGLWPPDLRWF